MVENENAGPRTPEEVNADRKEGSVASEGDGAADTNPEVAEEEAKA